MAIVYTRRANTANNRNFKVWDCTVAADGDTGPDIQAHAFGVIPFVWIACHITAAASPEWAVTADATNVTLTKLGSAGSAGGGPPAIVVTVFAVRPSSLIK